MQFDLRADTEWIRRAAATLDEAGHAFLSTGPVGCSTVVAHGSLGGSAEAGSVVRVVNLRSGQADGAAAQLSSVAAGLADRLRLTADKFDSLEAVSRPGRK
jgi:hypothetical protein